MLNPNRGLDQAAPKFFMPGPYEANAEDQVELFEWLQGITATAFAHLDEVSHYE